MAGNDTGTSISIGYIGESYIDYGEIWMMMPIFLYGLWCRFYLQVVRTDVAGSRILRHGLDGGRVCGFRHGDRAGIKRRQSMGFLITSLIVALLYTAVVAPRVTPWLVRRR